jgi:hypothetical protein
MLTCESFAGKSVAPAKSDEHLRRGARLEWITISVRPSSARDQGDVTGVDMARCWGLARQILKNEPQIAAASLHGCDGDGWSIFIRVDLPDTGGSEAWIRLFLEGLALRYRAFGAAIDVSPSRAVEPVSGSLEPRPFDLPRWLASHAVPPLSRVHREELRVMANSVPGAVLRGGDGPPDPTRTGRAGAGHRW